MFTTYVIDTNYDFFSNFGIKPWVTWMVNSTFLFKKGFVRFKHDLKLLFGIFAKFLLIKYFKNDSKQKVSLIKVSLLILYSSIEKKFGRIRLIFDIEKWHWKLKVGKFQTLISNRKFANKWPFKVRKCYLTFK